MNSIILKLIACFFVAITPMVYAVEVEFTTNKGNASRGNDNLFVTNWSGWNSQLTNKRAIKSSGDYEPSGWWGAADVAAQLPGVENDDSVKISKAFGILKLNPDETRAKAVEVGFSLRQIDWVLASENDLVPWESTYGSIPLVGLNIENDMTHRLGFSPTDSISTAALFELAKKLQPEVWQQAEREQYQLTVAAEKFAEEAAQGLGGIGKLGADLAGYGAGSLWDSARGKTNFWVGSAWLVGGGVWAGTVLR